MLSPRNIVARRTRRTRGVCVVRAESSPAEVLAEVGQAFADFRERHDKRQAELERIVDDQAAAINALRISNNPGDGIHPAAGLRGDARRMPVIDSETSAEFRAQMLSRPSASMTTQSDPDGGYAVSPQVDGVIDTVMRDLSPLRSIARVVQIAPGKGHWEKIQGRSGSQSAWAGEEDDRDDTDTPILGKIEIHPHELYAIPMLTNHVLEDAGFDLNSFLAEDVAGEFSLTEGAAFILGDGAKKPRGILTYDTTTEDDAARAFGKLQYVATGADGAFAASNPSDKLLDLVTKLRPVYRKGGGVSWLMNSTTANVVRKFKDGQGNYLWSASIAAGQPDRLAGYPVTLDEGMPDIASDEFAIAFGNWARGYAIVDKPGLRLIVDRVTKKGWTKMYFSRRVGGGLVDSNAIKLLKFSAS